MFDKIANKTARVCVIGLGYVGLPLAIELAREGFSVVGLDTDARKVEGLSRGESYIRDVPSEKVRSLVTQKKFTPTTTTKCWNGCCRTVPRSWWP